MDFAFWFEPKTATETVFKFLQISILFLVHRFSRFLTGIQENFCCLLNVSFLVLSLVKNSKYLAVVNSSRGLNTRSPIWRLQLAYRLSSPFSPMIIPTHISMGVLQYDHGGCGVSYCCTPGPYWFVLRNVAYGFKALNDRPTL